MSKKVEITADAVLAIVSGIFEDEDVNLKIADTDAPENWQGKTIGEILNVHYYTFKHRPASTNTVINQILQADGQVDHLQALDKAYCLLSLGNVERLYSKDVDMAVLDATLEYYIQSDKVKILEQLIERSNIETSGLRIPVQFGDQVRKAIVVFGRPNVGDIKTGQPHGETALVEVRVAIMLYPNVVSYSDYSVSMTFTEDGQTKTSTMPLASISIANVMTQKSVPYMNNKIEVGSINLSRGKTFVLVFEGYDNDFINYLADKALNDEPIDNNKLFIMQIRRKDKAYTHNVVIKDHQMITNADTGNETHTLTVTKRGKVNGTT